MVSKRRRSEDETTSSAAIRSPRRTRRRQGHWRLPLACTAVAVASFAGVVALEKVQRPPSLADFGQKLVDRFLDRDIPRPKSVRPATAQARPETRGSHQPASARDTPTGGFLGTDHGARPTTPRAELPTPPPGVYARESRALAPTKKPRAVRPVPASTPSPSLDEIVARVTRDLDLPRP
jgi:hypothetical protein